jgi:hypothetical protein
MRDRGPGLDRTSLRFIARYTVLLSDTSPGSAAPVPPRARSTASPARSPPSDRLSEVNPDPQREILSAARAGRSLRDAILHGHPAQHGVRRGREGGDDGVAPGADGAALEPADRREHHVVVGEEEARVLVRGEAALEVGYPTISVTRTVVPGARDGGGGPGEARERPRRRHRAHLGGAGLRDRRARRPPADPGLASVQHREKLRGRLAASGGGLLRGARHEPEERRVGGELRQHAIRRWNRLERMCAQEVANVLPRERVASRHENPRDDPGAVQV